MPTSTAAVDDPLPNGVPSDWWSRSSDEVKAWMDHGTLTIAGPLFERLMFAHPDLVVAALQQRAPTRAAVWHRAFDDRGQPLPFGRRGEATGPLQMVLRHGTPAMLDAALTQGLTFSPREHVGQLGTPMALALLLWSRTMTIPGGHPLKRFSPDERWAHERAMLDVLIEHERGQLGAEHTGETLTHAVRLNVPSAVLDALAEHGVDREALRQGQHVRAAWVTRTELILRTGDPEILDRFLTWGLPIGHGPGDDGMALDVVGLVLPAQASRAGPTETGMACVQRQIALLTTLEKHGWSPGPRFRREAFVVAAGIAADPCLWPHLIERGADPGGRNAVGNTALHQLGHFLTQPEHVHGLLALGLDPLATNDAGHAPMDVLADRLNAVDSTPGQCRAWQALEQAVLDRTLRANGWATHDRPAASPRSRL